MSKSVHTPQWFKQRWFIVDPRILSVKNIGTFSLPPKSALSQIEIGNSVKLWFRQLLSPGGGERLWVVITEIKGDSLTGTVDNGAHQVPLSFGDAVNFRRHHIMDIDWKDHSNPSEEMKEINRIMGMLDHFRRPPTALEARIFAERVTDIS